MIDLLSSIQILKVYVVMGMFCASGFWFVFSLHNACFNLNAL